MKKIIVVPAPNGVYLVTVTGGRGEAGLASVTQSYSAEDLPGVLERLGADESDARGASAAVDKHGSWMIDVAAYCDECVRLRDILIEKLTVQGAFLQSVIASFQAGNSEGARDAQVCATRAGDEIGEALAGLDDHAESHH